MLFLKTGAYSPLQRTKHGQNNIAQVHAHTVGQLKEVKFHRWSERCECQLVLPNFTRQIVPDRWCSTRKWSLTKRVSVHRGKTKNGSIKRSKNSRHYIHVFDILCTWYYSCAFKSNDLNEWFSACLHFHLSIDSVSPFVWLWMTPIP